MASSKQHLVGGTCRGVDLRRCCRRRQTILANPQPDQTTAEVKIHGSVLRGKQAIYRYGCAACYTIPGIRAGAGQVGPDLTYVVDRAEIAGKFPNDPKAMVRQLVHP